jgi:hypothetical protein
MFDTIGTMKRVAVSLLLVIFMGACILFEPTGEYAAVPAYLDTPDVPTISGSNEIQLPPFHASWQIQYTSKMDYSLDVDVYNIDLFDTPVEAIQQLKDRGVYVMCYFSAGSFEDWRSDAAQFPQETLGADMEGWAGEKWLDIRQVNALAPVMEARLDLAVQKGCDGVDPDNVNGYVNNTGFPLSYQDQLAFNIYLAKQAHQRGLAIGLKNDLEQIPDLLPFFDWELNEQCFYFNECNLLKPFVDAGKPVFVIEYELSADKFCQQAVDIKFNAIQKHLELDSYIVPCQ